MLSDEAEALFSAAAELGLVASLAAGPGWQQDLRVVARRHPGVPVLCHHLGDVRAGDHAGLLEVVASAAVPNIYVKVSGFHYVSSAVMGSSLAGRGCSAEPDLRRLWTRSALLGLGLPGLDALLHLPPVARGSAHALRLLHSGRLAARAGRILRAILAGVGAP